MSPARLPLLLLVAIAFGHPAPADFVLTEDGEPRARIVVADDARPLERFAARELARYVTRMSGAPVPIVRESAVGADPGGIIAIGATGIAKAAGIAPTDEDAGYDGYALRATAKRIIIRGRRPKGTVFGAYRLLESLGCRFYGPWAQTEIVPAVRSISIGPADRTVRPRVRYRSVGVSASRWTFLFRRQFQSWLYKIGMSDLQPLRAAQTYGGPMFVPMREYFDEHPEWFALRFGERGRGDERDLCTSNPALRAEFARKIVEWFRRFPDQQCAPVNVGDGASMCECKPCRALDDPDHPDDRLRRMILWANDIAERVLKEVPGKRFGLYGYYPGSVDYPDAVRVHGAIFPSFFPDLDFEHQLQQVEKWSPQVHGIYVYHWLSLHTGVPSQWLSDHTSLYRDFDALLDHGAEALSPEALGWSLTDSLMIYFLAQQAWHDRFDVEAAQDAYVEQSFGPAAAHIRKFYAALERSRSETPEGFYGQYHPRDKTIEAMNHLLNKARSVVRDLDPAFRFRIDVIRMNLKADADLARCRALTTQYVRTRRESDRIAAAKSIESAVAFVEAIRDLNLVWQDRFLGGPYHFYPQLRSIVYNPPRTRFEGIGPFKHYYDSMYTGILTLADAIESRNVTARSTVMVLPETRGELLYEFVAPEGGVFDSVDFWPHVERPSRLSEVEVAVSRDGGVTWTDIAGRLDRTHMPARITELVRDTASFLVRYRATNGTDRHLSFFTNPIVEGTTIHAALQAKRGRYWDGWDRPPHEREAAVIDFDLDAIPRAVVPDELVLFRDEADLANWGGYHQNQEYFTGKGADDDSCIRKFETEGPGSTWLAAIPAEPGDRFRLSFHIEVAAGDPLVCVVRGRPILFPGDRKYERFRVAREIRFEPQPGFRQIEMDIRIPDEPMSRDESVFNIIFQHKATGTEFFVDDVVLRRVRAR